MKEIENNNVYLTLGETTGDEVILKHNLEALREARNADVEETAKALVSIPAALVRMKWQNRRDIYMAQIKEEIYGAALMEIIARKPELKEKILAQVEASYQHLLARETTTLRISRRLADNEMRTTRVPLVVPPEDAPAVKPA